jgi:alkanesulfonate monooxygenase SsuD/methylene tetrahydromethanopterin reductase-like flavin-dependent oxidoreductase (luciferase family)
MDYGVHLPLIGFEEKRLSLSELVDYVVAARELGYSAVTANDHLVYSKPWLDGPTALAAVVEASGLMTLATSVTLLAVRGPAAVAKALGAIDILSDGRLVAAVGPGSSPRDYETVGVPWDERWKRLDDGILALRALWRGDTTFKGRFYSTEGLALEPRPVRVPPIWIGSWGSDAGLRRVARLADGWLASAYNTTPGDFATSLNRLNGLLKDAGRDAGAFPNALATMWFHITDDPAERDRVLYRILAPMTRRPVEELEEKLCIGAPEECADKLRVFAAMGLQRVYIWPVLDPVRQIERFREKVVPLTG